MNTQEAQIVLNAIKSRRSIRKFKKDEIPQTIIDQVVEAGTYAASGKSEQPWLVIELTNKEIMDRIRRDNAIIMGKDESADPFYGAPVYLIVLSKRNNPNHVYDGTLMMGNMMLAAHALGLGTCWINRAREEFEKPEWKEWLKSLGVDEDYEGIGHLAIGYPDGEARPAKERKQCLIKVD